MFLTIFLSVWSGLHVYVFWRAASIPIIKQHISPKLLIVIAVLLWSSFLLPRFMENSGADAIGRRLEMVGANWLGIIFLLFSCLFAVDVLTVFGLGFPRAAPKLRGLALLAGRPESAATIFLSHRPEGMEEAADAGVELMLCAHTHGGQIWPFDYIAGAANSLLAGRYEVRNMPVVVCRGTGTWGPRMRLWPRSEILRITLRRPIGAAG